MEEKRNASVGRKKRRKKINEAEERKKGKRKHAISFFDFETTFFPPSVLS